MDDYHRSKQTPKEDFSNQSLNKVSRLFLMFIPSVNLFIPIHILMEKDQHGLVLLCSVLLLLVLIAFSTCIASEFKKSKAKDVKLNGGYCHLPESTAFILGVFACVCVAASQIIGNIAIVASLFSQQHKIFIRERRVPLGFVLLSWISFGLSMILLGVATSMNGEQFYGEGWLDRECYVVKDGVYTGAAVLILTTGTFVLVSILAMSKLSTQQIGAEAKTYAGMPK